jgi:hypothetical protein
MAAAAEPVELLPTLQGIRNRYDALVIGVNEGRISHDEAVQEFTALENEMNDLWGGLWGSVLDEHSESNVPNPHSIQLDGFSDDAVGAINARYYEIESIIRNISDHVPDDNVRYSYGGGGEEGSDASFVFLA